MKVTKRILIGLLALALLVPCFMIGSSADTTVADAGKLLEYFDAPVYKSVNYDANGTGVADPLGLTTTIDVTDGIGAYNGKTTYTLDLPVEAGKGYLINFKLLIDKGATTKEVPQIVIQLKGKNAGGSEIPVTVFDANVNTGAFVVADQDLTKLETPIAPAISTWYQAGVEVVPDEDGNYQIAVHLTIGEGEETVYTTTAEGFSASSLYITLAGNSKKRANTFTKIDYFELYGGTFLRRLGDKEEFVDPMIKDLVAFYDANVDTLSVDDKITVLSALDRVASVHAYVPKDTDAQTALAKAQSLFASLYTDLFVNGVEGITEGADYAERCELLEVLAGYKAKTDPASAVEAVVNAFNKYNAEEVRLGKIKEDADAVLGAVASFPADEFNFTQLKAAYDVVSAKELYASYPGAADAASTVAFIKEEYAAQTLKADTFIEKIAAAAVTTDPFADRFAAYTLAKANYYDDEAYEGITAALATYSVVAPELNAVEEKALDFISKVNKANSSTYYSAKLSFATEADEIKDTIEQGYPGVVEAIELLAQIKQSLTTDSASVKAYIEAINALNLDASFADLKAAVEAGLALQAEASKSSATSIVDGENVYKVSDANVKLSEAERKIRVIEGGSNTFINAVGKIDANADLASLRASILAALAAKDAADETFAGVADAATALDNAIKAYNDNVKTANDGFVAMQATAFDVTSASAPVAPVASVCAILKKIFA